MCINVAHCLSRAEILLATLSAMALMFKLSYPHEKLNVSVMVRVTSWINSKKVWPSWLGLME